MNRHQRNKNRVNAAALAATALQRRLLAHTCENCGERGGHWIQTCAQSLEDVLHGRPDQGFWACPKLYGEDGRRLDTSGYGQAVWGGLLGVALAAGLTPNGVFSGGTPSAGKRG